MADILYQTVRRHRIFLFESAPGRQIVIKPPKSIEMRDSLYE
jgi:hypothetical protein